MACMRSNIYELVGESSILSLVSLFVPLTLGLYWKKASGAGAIASMFAGILSWLILELADSEIPPLIPATMISLMAMIVGSYVRPDKTQPAHDLNVSSASRH
jgi:SSS family solute:Na+ symporter